MLANNVRAPFELAEGIFLSRTGNEQKENGNKTNVDKKARNDRSLL